MNGTSDFRAGYFLQYTVETPYRSKTTATPTRLILADIVPDSTITIVSYGEEQKGKRYAGHIPRICVLNMSEVHKSKCEMQVHTEASHQVKVQ